MKITKTRNEIYLINNFFRAISIFCLIHSSVVSHYDDTLFFLCTINYPRSFKRTTRLFNFEWSTVC